MVKHSRTFLLFVVSVLVSVVFCGLVLAGRKGTGRSELHALRLVYHRNGLQNLWKGISKSEGNSDQSCGRMCGNVAIPYPFGLSQECAFNSYFVLNCTYNLGADLTAEGEGPWPLLTAGTGTYTAVNAGNGSQELHTVNAFQVEQIGTGSLIINVTTIKAMSCDVEAMGNASISLEPGSPFLISASNLFFVYGCVSVGSFSSDAGAGSECGPISCANLGQVSPFCLFYDCCAQSVPVAQSLSLNGGGISFLGMERCGFSSVLYPTSYQYFEDGRGNFGGGIYGLEILWYIRLDTSGDSPFNCSAAQKDEISFECAPNANCLDFPYQSLGYYCNCSRLGYEGDGYKKGTGCEDIDECIGINSCTQDATCVNLPGGYECLCPPNKTGNGLNRTLDPNGTNCTWIDRCNEGVCSTEAKCVLDQVTGNHNCTCQGGFVGNGRGKDGCKPKSNTATIIGVSVGGVVFLILNGLLLCFLYRRRKHAYELAVFSCKELLDELAKHEGAKYCKVFSLTELQEATSNFSDDQKLGAGGFGTVFVGKLKDGTRVAVKKADHTVGESRNEAKQFVNEIIILSQVNHRHLVSLLGCCLETPVPILVYEFVPNGDLEEHILTNFRNGLESQVSKHPPLNWNQRLKIAVETAEALNYLHWGTTPPIHHQDVKCANILLDANYNVKVADFGLSQLTCVDAKEAATRVLGGTPGYLDPDFFDRGELTDKSDVYSFGVVVLVLLTGQKPVDLTRPPHDQNLAVRCTRLAAEGLLVVNLDPELAPVLGDPDTMEVIHSVAKVALRCVKRYTDERPNMKEVLAELQTIERTSSVKKTASPKTWSRKPQENQPLILSQDAPTLWNSLFQTNSFHSQLSYSGDSQHAGLSSIEMGTREREVGPR